MSEVAEPHAVSATMPIAATPRAMSVLCRVVIPWPLKHSFFWITGGLRAGIEMWLQTQRTCRLTASRFAEYPCGGAARPATTSIAPKPTPGWPGSVEDPRPSGCFAKRSGEGSSELLGLDVSSSAQTGKPLGHVGGIGLPFRAEFDGEHPILSSGPGDEAQHCYGEEESGPSPVKKEAAEGGGDDSKVHGVSDMRIWPRYY